MHWLRLPPTPREIFLVFISVKRLSEPEGHSGAGRVMSMKNASDTIGSRTRVLPTCSEVPQDYIILTNKNIEKKLGSIKFFYKITFFLNII
jgi:hypothetical protein